MDVVEEKWSPQVTRFCDFAAEARSEWLNMSILGKNIRIMLLTYLDFIFA